MLRFTDEEKKNLEHVQRPPLPWRREAALTECGLPVAGHPVISRDEFIAKLKEQGKQRAAMTTCMTCYDTAQRHPTWEEDPVMRLSREINWSRREGVLKTELLALAALVSRHRDEFTELLQDQKEIVA